MVQVKTEKEAQAAEPVKSRRGRVVAGVVVVIAIAAGGGWYVIQARTESSRLQYAAAKPSVKVSTAAVKRADVATRRVVNGTLGYSGSFDVATGRGGVLTSIPKVGTVVKRGKAVFEIDGVRVPLLYGARPGWRDLSLGVRNGVDVRQLERNLKALGYGKDLTVDRHYSLATYYAVRRWQKAAKLPVTGSVPMGQVAYAPGPVRVGKHEAVVGNRVGASQQVLHGTGTQPAVLVRLNPAELPQIKVGDPVIVTLPDGKTRKAKISSVAQVAVSGESGTSTNGGKSSVAPVTIALKSKVRGFLDQALVQVAIISQQHKHVLAVPVSALLARTLGNYEVVVVDGGARRRVPVRTSLFDESSGLAEVTGDLREGMMVEVPDDGA
ncbi:peptidoglycan-binding protein [Nonomuraea guangzhouensis]|uniref:peptidoglycan-binding protein n=1 Tax=Nonomuraea guangzhouensis TaxID=1291555 RepID=UPI001C60124B|nr:peptidoglycan-binding protein [Nonomuraea guangzhouensis]